MGGSECQTRSFESRFVPLNRPVQLDDPVSSLLLDFPEGVITGVVLSGRLTEVETGLFYPEYLRVAEADENPSPLAHGASQVGEDVTDDGLFDDAQHQVADDDIEGLRRNLVC